MYDNSHQQSNLRSDAGPERGGTAGRLARGCLRLQFGLFVLSLLAAVRFSGCSGGGR